MLKALEVIHDVLIEAKVAKTPDKFTRGRHEVDAPDEINRRELSLYKRKYKRANIPFTRDSGIFYSSLLVHLRKNWH